MLSIDVYQLMIKIEMLCSIVKVQAQDSLWEREKSGDNSSLLVQISVSKSSDLFHGSKYP